jgi:CHAT domain-containing protein/Tfp pilus assembly protein PilF
MLPVHSVRALGSARSYGWAKPASSNVKFEISDFREDRLEVQGEDVQKKEVQEEKGAEPLVPDRPAEGELAGGGSHLYTIKLEAGQYLKVVVDQRGVSIIVALTGPDGKEIVVVGPGGTSGPEPLYAIASTSGDYRLEVRSADKKAPPGRYEARIEEMRAASAEDKMRVTAALDIAEAKRLQRQDTADASRKAQAIFEGTLPRLRSLGDVRGEADSLHEAGELRLLLGDTEKSVDYFEHELVLRHRLGDSNGEAYVLFRIGIVYSNRGDQHKALSYYEQALPMIRASGDRDKEAQLLDGLSHAYNYLGEVRKSLDYTTQALKLCRSIPGCEGELKLLVDTGGIYRQLDENQKALDYYDLAFKLAREKKDRRREAYILNSVGDIMYRSLGDTASALTYFEEALALRRAVGDRMGEARTLASIGAAHELADEKQKAIEDYGLAISLVRAISDRRQEAIILGQLGSLYQSTGDFRLAEQSYQQSLELARALGHVRAEANALMALGWLQASLGGSQKALEYYRQALPLWRSSDFRTGEAATLYRKARAERDLGSLTEARSDAEGALRTLDSLRAEFGSEQARALFLASADEPYAFYVDLLMRMHAANPSEGYDRLALEASERARARSLLDLLSESRADLREGVDPALLERERDLRQRLNARAATQTALLSRKHSEKEAGEIAKSIVEATGEYEEVEAQIRERSPRYASVTQPRSLTLAEIQRQVLDPDTLLLEYRLGPENSYLWAVSTSSISSYRLPPRAEIESAARGLYEALIAYQPVAGETRTADRERKSGADREYELRAPKLSQVLLGPVVSRLGTKRLLIVSDGALQYLPFGALPTPGLTSGSADVTAEQGYARRSQSEGLPLIAKHEIVSVPSASVLAVLRQDAAGRTQAPRAVAVLADPVFDRDDPRVKSAGFAATAGGRETVKSVGENLRDEPRQQLERAVNDLRGSGTRGVLSRLPFTRQEAEAITSMAPRNETLKALDFKASREAASSSEIASYRVVHFATHGLLDDQHPELSGLVLSLVDEAGRPQDGFLRLNEIYNLRLNADLVVLSACQTGLGKDVRGEGLVGLARGFMYAGAQSVAASLWKVDDVATRDFMKTFYYQMLKSRLRPAAALRAAQLEMLNTTQWRAPYYWAAFVLQGEWK